jgi:hypothetical protein
MNSLNSVLLFQNIKENRHGKLSNPHYCDHVKSCKCANRLTRFNCRIDQFELNIY